MTNWKRTMKAAAGVLVGMTLLAGCSLRSSETLEISRGVFVWVNRDEDPQRTWTYRGKMTVHLTPDYAYVVDGKTRIVVPREKVVYVAEATDPGEWK